MDRQAFFNYIKKKDSEILPLFNDDYVIDLLNTAIDEFEKNPNYEQNWPAFIKFLQEDDDIEDAEWLMELGDEVIDYLAAFYGMGVENQEKKSVRGVVYDMGVGNQQKRRVRDYDDDKEEGEITC